MNLNLDFSVVSRLFGGLVNDLRQKKLWPVAVLLLAALVAVPILLSKSSSPAPQPQAQVPVTPPPSGASIPALNVRTSPSYSHLNGAAHNPFGSSSSTTGASSTSPTSAASTAVSNAANTALSSLAGGSGSSTATGSGGSSPAASTNGPSSSGSSPTTSGSSNPPSITGSAKPKPAPAGLKPTQAYDVSLAITNASGGINTTDPLRRLSVIPSDQQPMLVELGVEQGGKRILFAVQPGTIATGPGTCTPGPIDCEILSLGQDQTEQLSAQTGGIVPSRVALFAVTGVSAANYSSAAAADRARREASAAGRAVLAKHNYPALSLFQYEPSLGSVVDLRNLRVGG
jgi:hypothetical protein